MMDAASRIANRVKVGRSFKSGANWFCWAAASLIGLVLVLSDAVLACTTGVFSGASTPDGRPLLWKNRDADDLHNQVISSASGRYPFVGLVNQGDVEGLNIWSGLNAAGFAIMNSASYNMEPDKDTKGEGQIMRLALQSCATVEDFESLLKRTDLSGRDVSANFGVIDARGGAAYFETGIKGYKRYDAAAAPGGYLLRTNYSESGSPKAGTGFTRSQRELSLVRALGESGTLDARWILEKVARDLANDRIGSDPVASPPRQGPTWAYTGDSICRYDTASCTLVAGVRAGEDPRLSTAWVLLGQPISGAAVPLWVASGAIPTQLAAGPEPSPLNRAFDAIRDRVYPDSRGDMRRYLDLSALADPKWDFLKALLAAEKDNLARAREALERWRKAIPPPAEMARLQEEIAQRTLDRAQALLPPLSEAIAPKATDQPR